MRGPSAETGTRTLQNTAETLLQKPVRNLLGSGGSVAGNKIGNLVLFPRPVVRGQILYTPTPPPLKMPFYGWEAYKNGGGERGGGRVYNFSLEVGVGVSETLLIKGLTLECCGFWVLNGTFAATESSWATRSELDNQGRSLCISGAPTGAFTEPSSTCRP